MSVTKIPMTDPPMAVGAKSLQPRHAKLAVGAASALAVFLAETHNERAP